MVKNVLEQTPKELLEAASEAASAAQSLEGPAAEGAEAATEATAGAAAEEAEAEGGSPEPPLAKTGREKWKSVLADEGEDAFIDRINSMAGREILEGKYPESQLIAEWWNRMAGLEVHNEED